MGVFVNRGPMLGPLHEESYYVGFTIGAPDARKNRKLRGAFGKVAAQRRLASATLALRVPRGADRVWDSNVALYTWTF